MAKAYELENWLEKKIRRVCWNDSEYIFLSRHTGAWISELGSKTICDLNLMFSHNDWEVYEEPNKKKTVTMYQPIRKTPYRKGHYWTCTEDGWHSDQHNYRSTTDAGEIVGWAERQVEVDE